MDQHDFEIEIEIEKLRLRADRFNARMELIRLMFILGAGLYALHMIMAGLGTAMGHSAAVISATSTLVKSLWGIIPSIAWFFERQGKKRAIKEKARFQQLVEKGDAYRSTSGLTGTGATPRQDRGSHP